MKLFRAADEYVAQSDWTTMAILKFCLIAFGVMAGVNIPKKHRKVALISSAMVFLATYIPLMTKFFCVWSELDE